MPVQRRPRSTQLAPGRTRGVTLVELLAVVAILGILMGVVWLAVAGRVKGAAKQTQIKADMRQVVVAVNLYRGDNDGGLPYSWKDFGYYGIRKRGIDVSDEAWEHRNRSHDRVDNPPVYDVSYHTAECAAPPSMEMAFWLFRTSVDRYEAKRRLNTLDVDQTVATYFFPACDPKTIRDMRWIHMYRDGKEVDYQLRGIRSLSANLSGTVSYQHAPDWVTELILAN